MPELPEVETVRRGLALELANRKIISIERSKFDLRRPIPVNLNVQLVGRYIVNFARRGKYLLLRLDNLQTLLIHLGMSGRMIIHKKDYPNVSQHDHLQINFEDGFRLVYTDPRRFGVIDLIDTSSEENHPSLARMGPEPLSEDFKGNNLEFLLQDRQINIKAALLDQRILAGIGNIYACEALFYAGISPKRLAKNVKGKRAEMLSEAIVSVLERAIDAGGSSLRDYANTSGELGYFQHNFAVYGREGKLCHRCGRKIIRIIQNGRSTFYCSWDQR
tara:strand:- start:82575 stop:83399 length:825 start_codon:yes stop_codon:yes gene_type:complete